MTGICTVCGKSFFFVRGNCHFCSEECRKTQKRINNTNYQRQRRIQKQAVKCSNCGKIFETFVPKDSKKHRFCSEICRNEYKRNYCRAMSYISYHKKNACERSNNVRASGLTYNNLPEKIALIKEKYKNGVPSGEIEKWIGVIK